MAKDKKKRSVLDKMLGKNKDVAETEETQTDGAVPPVIETSEAPPAETPPAETPPAETPPAETPPAETPPAETEQSPEPSKEPEAGKDGVLFEMKLKSREKRYALLRFLKTAEGKYEWKVLALNYEPISESQEYVQLDDAKENASTMLAGWQLINGLTVRSYLDRV